MNWKSLLPPSLRKGEPVIPVVRLAGIISPQSSALRPALSLGACAGALKRAFAYKAAPVVAIVVNSPGGSPVQSRLIHSRIRELAEKHGKRVLVFVEDVAASGGYMIALAGDEIVADETSIVGSIGVVSAGFGFDRAIDRLSIDRRVYTAGENKVLLDPFQPEKEGDVGHLRALQDEIHHVFIEMVRKARHGRLAEDDEIFSGLFWTGARARELGLVDTCGMIGPVIAERYGREATLKLIQPKRGLFGRGQPGIAPGIAGDVGASLAAGLPQAVLDTAAERAAWQRFGL